jgi:D-alanine-D-alanine ligase
MKRVAVLRGGPSEEYSVSMVTGNAVLNALKALDYPYKDIVITKQGEWLESGRIWQPLAALDAVDVVFVALHGQYGEDGQVQRILQRKQIPFTGSRAFPSAIAFNKELTKRTLAEHGILMPRHRLVNWSELDTLDQLTESILTEMGSELFVKPVSNGSSLGARYVSHKTALQDVLKELLGFYEQVLVEEFIRGKEAAVGVLDNFRRERVYTLPVTEVIPPGGEPLLSHESRYSGKAEQIVPGRFSYHEKTQLSEAAAAVHRIVGCKDYSSSDFIVRDGTPYFLEVNTLPKLTPHSPFPKVAEAVGLEFPALIKHLVEHARV